MLRTVAPGRGAVQTHPPHSGQTQRVDLGFNGIENAVLAGLAQRPVGSGERHAG
jgi:hypothetical protein